MSVKNDIPLLVEPDLLESLMQQNKVLVIDLCNPETYNKQHIPGSLHVDYAQIIRLDPPVGGLLPEPAAFNALIRKLGITADTHVICYDEEGGGNASRMIWTLHAYGHFRASLLNGGIFSWANEGHPMDQDTVTAEPSDYQLTLVGDNVIEAREIMDKLDSPDFALLDARSPAEFYGQSKFSARAGHIPGARLFEWTDAMDRNRNLRLKPDAELIDMLDQRGLGKDREIAVYCQTHHRSALSYFMLKHLGYQRVKGYHGAWSDWGNREDTPVETG
ncbi:MAG: sulfurtransferase [Gammaproteobacteria bacterium]|nr:sulfurtransferase [Gammaproteobacteria bacterium]